MVLESVGAKEVEVIVKTWPYPATQKDVLVQTARLHADDAWMFSVD